MNNENSKRSHDYNRTQKNRAADGSKVMRTDPPDSGGHYAKRKHQAEPRLTTRLRRGEQPKKAK